MSRRIYVASSWRNEYQPAVVVSLRKAGHEVYDFRNPRPGDSGFHWSEIDPEWQSWTPEEYREALGHSLAHSGFATDLQAMLWADTFVGVMPFGRSASMEMGWAVGADKETALLIPEAMEPELMVKMFGGIFCTVAELLARLRIGKDE